MIRLEKKEFEHKGFLCAIMKMEYANLKDLKEKDLKRIKRKKNELY